MTRLVRVLFVAIVPLLLLLLVAPQPAFAKRRPATREYFVAADEVQWDYAPSYPLNRITGMPFTPEEEFWLEKRVYVKARYRQYTDATFSTLVEQPEHLGILGPVLRAEVGDTIVVRFRNNTRFPTSIHPHGVFYEKDSEGAPYTDSADDLTNTAPGDDEVAPGAEWTYTWPVPARAGPGPADGTSVAWPYHGHTEEVRDTNAGLVGFLVITKKGKANADGSPRDVRREFFSLFTIFDENESSLAEVNGLAPRHRARCRPWSSRNTGSTRSTVSVGEQPRLRHGRGRPGPVVPARDGQRAGRAHGALARGDRARIEGGRRRDVVHLAPAISTAADLLPDNPGTWLFHCHVNHHIMAGMQTKFTITPR